MKENKKQPRYHGPFAIRIFFMQKLTKWFAKWYYKSFKKSKDAFRAAINCRSKFSTEYRYARYVVALTTTDDEMRSLHVAVSRWMRREKLTKLLDYTSDIFKFDDEVYIVTSRPGLWIGRYGRIVDGLTAYLREHLSPNITVCFKEMEDSVVNIRRTVSDFNDCFLLDDYAAMSPWLMGKEFLDYVEDYIEDNPPEKKLAPLYESINTSDKETSAEYATLDLSQI